MALFIRKPVILAARRATTKSFVTERGKELPVNPGDWLLTDKNGKTFVNSDKEFREGYDPADSQAKNLLSARFNINSYHTETAKFVKKPSNVDAVPVTEHGFIKERETKLPVQPGDWIITKKGKEPYALNAQDFRDTYRPANKEAATLLFKTLENDLNR